jgi:hypothetical protein
VDKKEPSVEAGGYKKKEFIPACFNEETGE